MRRADRTASGAEAAAVVPLHGVGTDTDVVARGNKVLYLIAPAANRVRAEVPLPSVGAVAPGTGAIWVTDQVNGRLLRVEG
jgi:hypothetical protein